MKKAKRHRRAWTLRTAHHSRLREKDVPYQAEINGELFDEILVGDWLHIEQMSEDSFYIGLNGPETRTQIYVNLEDEKGPTVTFGDTAGLPTRLQKALGPFGLREEEYKDEEYKDEDADSPIKPPTIRKKNDRKNQSD